MLKYEKLYENEELLVVNKPAGLLTHGAPHINEPSLAEQLLVDYPQIEKIGEDPFRPGIIHRLDKMVSGLIVVAKTQASFDNLKKQFKNRQVKKHYTALVYGNIDKEEGEIIFNVKRSSKGHKMAALPLTYKKERTRAGRTAITEFRVKKRYINYNLLDLIIKTGRTHQIRVHLAAFGHPVVGDNLYGTRKTKQKNAKLRTEFIFLLARKLAFRNSRGEEMEFDTDLPSWFKDFLNKIK